VPVNLASLDLNLLVALRALLEERNVTRAGLRVGLSQPAMSAALARLRRHFGDELLVRNGNRYELTPLGTALHAPAVNSYAMLERLFTSRADFQPATERHEFTLLSSDYAIAVFGTALARVLHTEAPGVRLQFLNMPSEVVENAESVLSGVDGLLMPHGVIGDLPAVELYRDESRPTIRRSATGSRSTTWPGCRG
jgi:DNA-binding transcriptional LysR family regulator